MCIQLGAFALRTQNHSTRDPPCCPCRPYAGAAGAQPQPTALRAVPQQAGGSSGPFVSYCIQKLASGRANHAAFWLQDEHGESLLAVVVRLALPLQPGARPAAFWSPPDSRPCLCSASCPALQAALPPLPPAPHALQGTDARLSGHFTYSTTPAFMDLRLAPALRCTNRSIQSAESAFIGHKTM